MEAFSYDLAFSRNIGWLTSEEQHILKTKSVAIPGMGGVGGVHALNLARFGISNFKIADIDVYEVGNFNRQAGAFMSTIGKHKADVMKEMILDINPEASVEVYRSGVNKDNIEDFLTGTDILCDGLDIYAMKARVDIFDKAYKMRVPIMTAGPIGMGSAFIAFHPDKVGPMEYFNFKEEHSDLEKLAHFLAGLSPNSFKFQMKYLMDPNSLDISNHKTPSTPVGCALASGVITTNIVKSLLNRGKIIWAPRGIQFDAYLNKSKISWRPWGNRNPIQRLIISFMKSKFNIT